VILRIKGRATLASKCEPAQAVRVYGVPKQLWQHLAHFLGLIGHGLLRQLIQRMRSAVGRKTRGFSAIGIFLLFGAVMAGLAAITLLSPGTPLDSLWVLNPIAYEQLAPLGRTVGILFLLLGAALTTAGVGWFRRRLWGWRFAVVIIATQVVGDLVNCVTGDLLRGGTGVIIAGALLLFLLQPKIRDSFA
jgi:hypothetical protein